MACVLTRSRAEACKDVVAGIKEVYFIDFGGLGTVTLGSSDEITNMTGDSSNAITLHKYPVKGNNSFETTINASRENGTVFYEQTLNITLKKLTKEDHKELKLLAAARPHIIVVDKNDNAFMMGLEEGSDLTEGTVSTGNALGDFNGYNYTFVAQEVSPPNFLVVDTTSANFPVSNMAGLSGTITIGTPATV
tara:strand:+ start:360 stop:935 length:576 start_codon:yes stop_codon:yes gene_type:complete